MIMLTLIITALILTCEIIQGQESPKFEKHETYQDIFPLTQRNFTQKVLKNEDVWIVLFHSGTIKRSWKTMAVNYRGVISFGMININEEAELIGKLEYDINDGKEVRVYPYGSKSTKQKYMLETSNPNEATSKATKSIPNYILDIKNMGIEDFLVDSFVSNPSRFPLIIFTESKELDSLYKMLAMKLERYYNFGHIVNPSTADLVQLGIQDVYLDMPAVIVLTTESNDLEDPKFNAVQYMKSSMGEISYPNVLQFLININKQFRHKLPGENMSHNKEDVEMTEVIESESEKFKILDHHVHTNVVSDNEFIIEDGLGGRVTDEL